MQRDDIVGKKVGTPGREACKKGKDVMRKVGMHAGRKACWGGKQACMQRGMQGGRKEGRQEGRKPCKEAIASRHAGGRQEGRQAGGGYTDLGYIVRYVQSRAEGARAAMTDLILSVRVPYAYEQQLSIETDVRYGTVATYGIRYVRLVVCPKWSIRSGRSEVVPSERINHS